MTSKRILIVVRQVGDKPTQAKMMETDYKPKSLKRPLEESTSATSLSVEPKKRRTVPLKKTTPKHVLNQVYSIKEDGSPPSPVKKGK